jgi:two-component system, LytTR family, sensor kinase
MVLDKMESPRRRGCADGRDDAHIRAGAALWAVIDEAGRKLDEAGRRGGDGAAIRALCGPGEGASLDSAGDTGRAAASMGRPVFIRVQAAALAIFVLVDVMAHFSVYDSLVAALTISLLVEPLIVMLALLLRAVFARWHPQGGITLRVLPGIVGLSLAAGVAAAAAGQMLRLHSGLAFDLEAGNRPALVALVYYFLVFVIWSVICFWTRAEMARAAARQRAAQAEALALRAEVERLRLQIDPHFLFNALNGIGEEIPENPEAALSMLRDLALFLRQCLAGIETPLVTVAAEAEALNGYLRVQRARFGPRLDVSLSVAQAVEDRRLPSLLLQPLVENAIKHGTRVPRLKLGIAIQPRGEVLELIVTNSGGLVAEGTARAGIGLANIRDRLRLHYPGRHRFELLERDGMVIARLELEGDPCSAS